MSKMEIWADMLSDVPRRYKTLQGALKALREGRARRVAFASEPPASGWVLVALDEEDPERVWVTQTDRNAVTNKSWAGTPAVRMKAS